MVFEDSPVDHNMVDTIATTTKGPKAEPWKMPNLVERWVATLEKVKKPPGKSH